MRFDYTPSGGRRTLAAALAAAHEVDRPGLTFVGARREQHAFSWREIARETERRAAYLRACGVQKGSRIALLVADNEAFVFAFYAAVALGAWPIALYPPSALSDQEAQLERATAIFNAALAEFVIAPEALARVIERLAERARACRSITTEALVAAPEVAPHSAFEPSIVPDDVCFLQFTSGSTAAPKGVIVTHANAIANIEALHAALGSDAERDIGVNWVPLYHDMGLIGSVVTPALDHARGVLIPTAAFALQPQLWLEQVHLQRGTMASTNNFGLRAACKRVPKIDGLDLSCLRVLNVGAEPIHLETVERFIATFVPYGLNPNALNAAYGMAEATLALACGDPSTRMRALAFDARRYAEERAAIPAAAGVQESQAKWVVSCGRVIPGHEVAVLDPDGQPLGEGHVGELVARGPSITRGYVDTPTATQALFAHGWMRTGDIGFLHEGELFVSGRSKDLIIIAGRNYDPQVFEWAATRVSGVRAHHVIAFAIEAHGEEQLVVLAECEHPARAEGLALSVRKAVVRETDLAPSVVLIVRPWSLPRTSSGKLQRAAARAAFDAGAVEALDAARAGEPPRAPWSSVRNEVEER